MRGPKGFLALGGTNARTEGRSRVIKQVVRVAGECGNDPRQWRIVLHSTSAGPRSQIGAPSLEPRLRAQRRGTAPRGTVS